MHVFMKLWFSGSKIEKILTSTENFLSEIGRLPQRHIGGYVGAINRTYLDASLTFTPPVDLSKLLRKEVHLALLAPMTGSWGGGAKTVGAAALAVDMVNANKSLLPGLVLKFSWADSGCSAIHGLAAMGELLGGASQISAVIGPACSTACEVVSHLTAAQNIPQISWGCTSPTLSNKKEYQLVSVAL